MTADPSSPLPIANPSIEGGDFADDQRPVDPLIGIKAKTGRYRGALMKRQKRRRMLGSRGRGHCYHVMSRTVNGELYWDDTEKEAMRQLIWKMAAFCGLEVMTYCVMSNHFHILVRVPDRAAWLRQFEGEGGEHALLAHLSRHYSKDFMIDLRVHMAWLRSHGREDEVGQILGRFIQRLCDLSVFMQELKARFARWLNKRRGRKGVQWMDRFRSVLVEGGEDRDDRCAAEAMAAYIDLNPVRAGIVTDPAEYRWSGYAEAVAGRKVAQHGISRVMNLPPEKWETVGAATYRRWLYEDGGEHVDAEGNVTRKGLDSEARAQVLEAGGALTPQELVRHQVRYFSEGVVLGSRGFVDGFIDDLRESGIPRRAGARALRDVEPGAGMFALRRL